MNVLYVSTYHYLYIVRLPNRRSSQYTDRGQSLCSLEICNTPHGNQDTVYNYDCNCIVILIAYSNVRYTMLSICNIQTNKTSRTLWNRVVDTIKYHRGRGLDWTFLEAFPTMELLMATCHDNGFNRGRINVTATRRKTYFTCKKSCCPKSLRAVTCSVTRSGIVWCW